MVTSWSYPTRRGTVFILPHAAGGVIRYQVVFEGDVLGSYATPEQAADDVAGGHTFMPSSGVDLGDLGISNDLGDWHRR